MDFEDELQQAIKRGTKRNADQKATDHKALLSKEEIRNRHNEFRLTLSDHIEKGLAKLQNHFPGFDYETIYGERGWGGAISRDDLALGPDGKGGSFFSRLEITVRPQNEYNIVNIAGKGTVKNKETANWNFYKDVQEASIEQFSKKIDQWILLYAEQFAAG